MHPFLLAQSWRQQFDRDAQLTKARIVARECISDRWPELRRQDQPRQPTQPYCEVVRAAEKRVVHHVTFAHVQLSLEAS
jgi:hypothetical protein